MNMLYRIAKQNRIYYRKRNLLIGIAIFLASFLIFFISSFAAVFQQESYASINAFNPNWQGQYQHVPTELADKLASHPDTGEWGLFAEMAFTELPAQKYVYYYCMSDDARDMLRLKLAQGHMPEAENEIALTPEAARQLGKSVKVGDPISLSYQVLRNGKADYSQQKEFIVSGILEDTEDSAGQAFTALISNKLLEGELPSGQVSYTFLFRISNRDISSTSEAENIIKNLAAEYQISEENIRINSYNLAANYTDPNMILIISIIICTVALAGIITIYSIYYVRIQERIQEFGRLKAIGMTQKELRRIVFLEGIESAKKAAPLGILTGLAAEIAALLILHANSLDYFQEILPWLSIPKLIILHIGTAALSLGTAFLMMYISMKKPMRTAAKITETEALRYPAYQNRGTLRKKARISRKRIHIFYLVRNHLGRYKTRSLLTILSMSATGILAIIVATVLSCTDARLYADDLCHGQYMIGEQIEFRNAEHPERKWENVIQDNPLTDDLLQKIKEINGVREISVFDSIFAEIPEISDKFEILGVPEENKSFLMDRITQGSVSYEALKSGEQVIVDEHAAKWYFHGSLNIGDTITYVVDTGNGTPLTKKAKIAAFGDYPLAFPKILMASDAFKGICPANCHSGCSVWGDEDYNKETENQIKMIIEEEPLLQLSTWQEYYELEQETTRDVTALCCIFLGFLGGICIMNMINTMISSVQQRKREIGILQAVGMTDRQLSGMLQLEGGLYILGTLFTTIACGSLLSWPVFLWAKDHGILGIRKYEFPFMAVCIIIVILIILEILLAAFLAHSARKDSIIDRIRL